MSPVQASDMAVKMAMTSGMAMPTDGDCSGCPDQGTDGGKMTVCPQVCVAPVLALLPENPAFGIAPPAPRLTPLRSSFLHGRDAVPDPYPPKPFGFFI
ncbi:hypothetical protein [Mesorhizobium sp. YR577]|uniref:hypothetical protein n=1 Tax=Mesorhizobium sp. YR577 TaxID=1884373 RepID=UPI001FCDA55D|nr:hypothetical protein [Mesorhizobium sp. YR577]